MIEIEEKYSCGEQTLQEIKAILREYSLNNREGHDGFFIDGSPSGQLLNVIEQEDTYFDLPGGELHQAGCSFRLRCAAEEAGGKEKENKYIFTVKRPTDSKNFGETRQFARFEFEMETKSPDLNGNVIRFVRSHLDLPALLGRSSVQDEEVPELLRPILTISNRRTRGTIRRCTGGREGSPFEAEICLDDVTYRRCSDSGDAIGQRDWQMELELKSEHLDRVLLKIFASRLRSHAKLIGRLTPESASKYKKARQLLGMED